MKNKLILKIAAISLASGFVLAILGLIMGANLKGAYFKDGRVQLANEKETKITELNLSSFKNIDIESEYADIIFEQADSYGIDIYDNSNGVWEYSVENETLKINNKEISIMLSFGINLNTDYKNNYVKIFLPQNAKMDEITINSVSGNMNISNINAENVELCNSYGNITLAKTTSNNLKINISSGNFTGEDLNLQNLYYENKYGKGSFDKITTQSFDATSHSGGLDLQNFHSKDIKIFSCYGDIVADNLYSAKIDIKAESGNVDIAGELQGENILRSSYGNITFKTTEQKSNYSYYALAKYGTITVDNENMGDNTSIKHDGNTQNNIDIEAVSGNIKINFGK